MLECWIGVRVMLAELKAKSQVTIPSRIVSDMGLARGDMFDVIADGGIIKLVPVVVYPKEEAERLERLAAEAKAQNLKVYESAEDAIASLHGATA